MTIGRLLDREADLAYQVSSRVACNNKGNAVLQPRHMAQDSYGSDPAESRQGKFLVHRKSRRDRMRAKLAEVKQELRKRMQQPIPEQGRWLGQVIRGYFAYHAVPTNRATVAAFHRYVVRLWHRTLRRRSQKDRFTWERMQRLAGDWLPHPRNFHPWPNVRFAVKYSR